jgi:hypothetical protein
MSVTNGGLRPEFGFQRGKAVAYPFVSDMSSSGFDIDDGDGVLNNSQQAVGPELFPVSLPQLGDRPDFQDFHNLTCRLVTILRAFMRSSGTSGEVQAHGETKNRKNECREGYRPWGKIKTRIQAINDEGPGLLEVTRFLHYQCMLPSSENQCVDFHFACFYGQLSRFIGFLQHWTRVVTSGRFETIQRNSNGSVPRAVYECGIPAGMNNTSFFDTSMV